LALKRLILWNASCHVLGNK